VDDTSTGGLVLLLIWRRITLLASLGEQLRIGVETEPRLVLSASVISERSPCPGTSRLESILE
jgi:hypothetical protein